MSHFKQLTPCIRRNSSIVCDSNINNNSHLHPSNNKDTQRSTNRHPLGLERTETHVTGMTEQVQPELNIGNLPLYQKGQVVLFENLFLLIKMIFKDATGGWSYAVETEDGMRRVIDENSISVPKQIGNQKPPVHDISIIEVSTVDSPPVSQVFVNNENTKKTVKKARRSQRRNNRWKRKAKRRRCSEMSANSFGCSQSTEIYPITSDIGSVCDELSFVSDTFFEKTDPPNLGKSRSIPNVNEVNIDR